MTETRSYKKGTVLFRKGDPGDVMYDILQGSIGIYFDYGGPDETQIAVLSAGELFGEMGLLNEAPRSADAVVLENGTELMPVSEADFFAYFRLNPAKVLQLMQQMSGRLRQTTADYLDACRTVYETVEAERAGKKKSLTLKERILKFCNLYREYGARANI